MMRPAGLSVRDSWSALPLGCDLSCCGALAELEHLAGRSRGEQVHEPRDDARPSGLVARAEARAVVAVEVLVEQNQIPPVRIGLELLGSTVDRTPPLAVAQEDAGEPPRQLLRDVIQIHPVARSGGTLDHEVV